MEDDATKQITEDSKKRRVIQVFGEDGNDRLTATGLNRSVVIDGGYGDNEASTVIDLSVDPPEIVREGKGSLEIF